MTWCASTCRSPSPTVPTCSSCAASSSRPRKSHPGVLVDPRSDVHLLGFGDNALDFELLVWSRDPSGQAVLKSDLYYQIEASLRRRRHRDPVPATHAACLGRRSRRGAGAPPTRRGRADGSAARRSRHASPSAAPRPSRPRTDDTWPAFPPHRYRVGQSMSPCWSHACAAPTASPFTTADTCCRSIRSASSAPRRSSGSCARAS